MREGGEGGEGRREGAREERREGGREVREGGRERGSEDTTLATYV